MLLFLGSLMTKGVLKGEGVRGPALWIKSRAA